MSFIVFETGLWPVSSRGIFIILTSGKLLKKLKLRFDKLLTPNQTHLLNPVSPDPLHKLHYQIFQKPHHKYVYPHFSSNHPQHIFTGIIKTETVRYSRLSSAVDDYNFIHKLFTFRLTALDYPYKLIIDNSFPWLPYNTHNQRTTNKKKNNNPNKVTVYYRNKYNKHMRTDKIVQQILRKYHNTHTKTRKSLLQHH